MTCPRRESHVTLFISFEPSIEIANTHQPAVQPTRPEIGGHDFALGCTRTCLGSVQGAPEGDSFERVRTSGTRFGFRVGHAWVLMTLYRTSKRCSRESNDPIPT